MLDPDEVKSKEFRNSHLYTKLNKPIVVSRMVNDGTDCSEVLACSSFFLEDSPLRDQIAYDYDLIRQSILNGDALTGRMGTFIQPRTKGRGHGSTSCGFYAKKGLVAHIVGSSDTRPNANSYFRSDPKSGMCSDHSGQHNEFNRSLLDPKIRDLPDNQSGRGRHKCVYCAYLLGLDDGARHRKNFG